MRVHLVDGTWELFRAHFAKLPSRPDPQGRERKAAIGVVFSMLRLLDDPKEKVTHIAIAFDNPIESFRNEIFDGYKTSDGVPPELLAQFDAVEEGARAIGIPVWSMDRWECDDALATGAAKFRDAPGVEQVRICSPDKDLGQCIRGRRVVTLDRMREKETDEEALVTLRGIRPASIPDWLGLVGDTADGIPGLDGFGETSSSALLARWGKIEAIPDDAAAWDVKVRGAEKLAATLREHRADALLYRKLATLVEDVPLAEDLAALEYRGVPRAAFSAWCDQVGAGETLRNRVRRWRDG